MKVYDLRDEAGRLFAFKVSNMFLSRKGLCKVVRSIPETQIVEASDSRSFLEGEDEFCEFEVRGQKFVAWEPFGDNSRYWIGPKTAHWCEEVEVVRSAFVNHKLLRFLT